MQTRLTALLGIEHPIILAPMFLVSNTQMIIEALNNGITGALPALNYRTNNELAQAIATIKKSSTKPFGINLIVNKSNKKLKGQLKTVIDEKVGFVITSLGNPGHVINQCKKHGIKVFCDVTDLKFALKVEHMGADAVIAVNSEAGGHYGTMDYSTLIPLLKQHCSIPVISAGGIATQAQYNEIIALGADGASIGSIFIASTECAVSMDYKNAIVSYGAADIVSTNKMSGSPLSVINTPYVQKIGTQAGFFERIFIKNKHFKNLLKIITMARGMKRLEKSANKATYKVVWVAGKSIEHITAIRPIKEIINSIVNE